MADREPYKWITVKGKHIPVYKDEHGQDVFGIGSESKQKSPVDMDDKELRGHIEKTFIDNDSYFKTQEYKDLQNYVHTAFETSQKLEKEWLEKSKEAEKEIDQDSYKELVEMFDGDKSLAKALADKTPKGRELQKEADELHKKFEEVEETHREAADKLERIKQKQSRSQYVDFIKDFQDNVKEYKQASKESDYKGFQFDTGIPYYNELRDKGAKIVEMTPKQYLQECAHRIFRNTTYENQVLVGMADTKVLKDLMKKIQNGTKMYLPYLNYKDDQQEGRHRAMAAMLLGIEKIPVMLIEKKY